MNTPIDHNSPPIAEAGRIIDPMPLGPQGPRRSPFNAASEWAKVGGADLIPAATNLFLTSPFKDAYRPGATRLIYVAGCPGLAELAKQIAMPCYSVSTTSPDRLAARIEEKRRDQYGAWRQIDGVWTWRPGFDEWFPSQLHPCGQKSPNSPVRADVRGILVRLPEGMSELEFDKAFDAYTRLGALDVWARTPLGQQHCVARGVDPHGLELATQYPGWAFSPALEICGFSIYRGVDRLVAIAEQIVASHLELSWTPIGR